MGNLERLNDLLDWAKRDGGFVNRYYVAQILGKIAYNTHYPIIFNPAFHKALFGKRYRQTMHGTLDRVIKGENPIDYLWEEKANNPK